MPRLAAVDVGSNTVHVLVADTDGRHLTDIAHYVEMPSLGSHVARHGRIGTEKGDEVLAALARVVAQAGRHHYQHLVAGATAAVRAAADGDDFLRRASARIATPVRLIEEEVEARLTFAGAASRHAARGSWVLVDLGGASTEVVAASGRRIQHWATLEIGSGTAGRDLGDPPTAGELEGLRAAASATLGGAPEWQPAKLVATGGTASNLPRVLSPDRRRRMLRGRDLEKARAILCGSPALQVAERTGLDVDRVMALRGGVEILLLLLSRYGVDGVHLSHEGLRHGMLLAFERRGDDWFRRS